MDAISYSTASAQLAGTMNKACENHLSPAQRWWGRTRSTAVRLIFSPEAWEDYLHPSSCFSRLLVAQLRHHY